MSEYMHMHTHMHARTHTHSHTHSTELASPVISTALQRDNERCETMNMGLNTPVTLIKPQPRNVRVSLNTNIIII